MKRTHATLAAVVTMVLAGAAAALYVVNREAKPGDATSATAASEVNCADAADRCACVEKQAADALHDRRTNRALELATGVVELCKTNVNVRALQAEALASMGHNREGAQLAREVLQVHPENRYARRTLAVAALAESDFARVDELLSKLLAEEPQDTASLYYAALAAARRDRYNDARQGFLRTLRLHKAHIDARYNLVLLTNEAGAHEEAAHHLERLKEIAPGGDARVASAAALVKARSGTPGSAVTFVQGKTDAGPQGR